jgi:hypothetical protein
MTVRTAETASTQCLLQGEGLAHPKTRGKQKALQGPGKLADLVSKLLQCNNIHSNP